LGVRHRLAPEARSADLAEAARSVVGLHATDPASMMMAARTRMPEPPVEQLERSLYVERSAVRMLGMRRTVFVEPVELLPVVQAACSSALVPPERRRFVKMLEDAGVAKDGSAWLRRAERAALVALRERGEATAAELSEDVAALRRRITLARGKNYEGTQSVGSRVLFLLSAEGRIVRGRPLGSWSSTLYRWTPTEVWLGEAPAEMQAGIARAELVRAWLGAYGPGTFTDLKWWTGWTAGQLKEALAEVRPEQVDLDGEPGLVLEGDLEPEEPQQPWAALLPSLDPTVMGWSQRDWYLGDLRASLFDRNGNAGPTVWWGGRVVGGWAQRKEGEIVFRLLQNVGADACAAIEEEAERLAAWLGARCFVPRFRTPLERELCA
jgi:hypothetical protein